MNCPNCDRPNSLIVWTEGVKRRRLCPECRMQWYTVEIIQEVAREQAFQAAMFSVRHRFENGINGVVNGKGGE